MDRKWEAGAAVGAPPLTNASDGYATDGNPGTGTPATTPGAHWFHMVTEEILSVLTGAAVAFDKTVVTQLRDAIYALIRGTTQTITSTGTQNDYAVTAARRLTLRCNNASLVTFTGFAAGQDGDEIEVISVGAGQVNIDNQGGGSTATNRVINQVTGTISLSPGFGTARLRYDATATRWRVLAHEQGAWITPTFSAGDFTGNGAMTWTVGAGDVSRYGYWLKGRTLHVSYTLITTTVGTGGDRPLKVKVPGGFTATAAGPVYTVGQSIDNAGTPAPGLIEVAGGATVIGHYPTMAITVNNWSVATDATAVRGTVAFEVQ